MPNRLISRAFSALAIFASIPPVAAAQAVDTAAVGDSAIAIAPVVVTTSRLPRSAGHAAFAARTLGPQELRARAPRTAVDLFRDEPGVFVDESVGPGGPAILRIRGGEEVFTLVQVDGVQINQNGGFFDMLGFRLSNLESVEIARGPQSAVHGSSAVSGLVHFLTPAGHEGAPVVRARLEGGAATEHGSRWHSEASVRGGGERLRYSAGVGAGYSRGIWDVPNDTRSRDGAIRLDYAPADTWALSATARNVFVETKLPVRDVGVTRAALDPNARDEFDRTILSLSSRHAGPGGTSHTFELGHYREGFVFEDEYDAVEGPGDAFVFDADLLFLAELRRTTARYTGGARAARAHTDFVWGAQWEREALSNDISGDFEDQLALDRNSAALFGEASWTPVESLFLLLGARAEKYERLDWEITPRFGVAVRMAEGVTLRGAAGRAYKAPNLQQQFVENPFVVANPDIRAESSLSTEVGLDLGWGDGFGVASVTLFRQSFDDLIRTVGVEGRSQQINRNLGEALAKGVEWSAEFRPTERLGVGTSGAWIRTEVVDNAGLSEDEYPSGRTLPFRPEVVASAFVEAREAGLWAVRFRVGRIGAQDVLSNRFSGPRIALAAYSLVGASAWYAVRPSVRAYARLDNLLGADYLTAFDRPGAPGSGTVGMEWVF